MVSFNSNDLNSAARAVIFILHVQHMESENALHKETCTKKKKTFASGLEQCNVQYSYQVNWMWKSRNSQIQVLWNNTFSFQKVNLNFQLQENYWSLKKYFCTRSG